MAVEKFLHMVTDKMFQVQRGYITTSPSHQILGTSDWPRGLNLYSGPK